MKYFAWILAALLAAAGLSAQDETAPVVVIIEEPAATAEVADTYEIFQLCFWDALPDSSLRVPTYGFKLGVLGSSGAPVCGAEAAVIHAGSDQVEGFKGSLVYTTGGVTGLALAPVNVNDWIDGVQIGAVNVAGDCMFQVGILNFNENGFLPVFPLINFSVK